MDPQATLQLIIDAVRQGIEKPMTDEDMDQMWSEVADHFNDLAGWLKRGGFTPIATGPIFGGYTATRGPVCGAPRVAEFVNVKYVRNSRYSKECRYAIMTADPQGEDFTRWVMVEYKGDDELQRWPFRISADEQSQAVIRRDADA